MSFTLDSFLGKEVKISATATVQMSAGVARLWRVTPNVTGRDIKLPDATSKLLKPGGPVFYITNEAAPGVILDIQKFDGTAVISIDGGESALMLLVSKLTAAGDWIAKLKAFTSLADAAADQTIHLFGSTDDQVDTKQYNHQTEVWVERANTPINHQQANGFTVAAIGYYFGKGSTGADQKGVASYNPATTTHTAKTNLAIDTYGQQCSQSLTRGYKLGGQESSGQKESLEYNPGADTWSLKTPHPFGSYFGGGVTFSDNTALVYNGLQTTTAFSNVYQYAMALDSWTTRLNYPAPNLHQFAYFQIEDEAYKVAGADDALTRTDVVHKYAPAGFFWQLMTPYPQLIRLHAGAAPEGKGHACGGFTTSSQNTNRRYSVPADIWTTKTVITATRRSHTLIAI